MTAEARRIVIDPITRIEGHSRITIELDEQGEVSDAHFHITQFRGFEKFTEGKPYSKLPLLTARTCGICPVSHLIASSKATDMLLSEPVPEVAANLRRVLNLAQILQSHALAFYYFSTPDLVLGMDSDPNKRHIFGVNEVRPDVARDGIALRKFGQQIIETLAGKRIHPVWVVPGGVKSPLSAEGRDMILGRIPDMKAAARRNLELFQPILEGFTEEIESFGTQPSMFMGMVGKNGELDHYDGDLRLIDAQGNIVEAAMDPMKVFELLSEKVEEWSYLKSPYYTPMGYPNGQYRVGPLARLNIVEKCGTPQADEFLPWFKGLEGGPLIQSSFHYHAARMIEMLYTIEKMEELLQDPGILDTNTVAKGELVRYEGVGISEAPRGTLMHHYHVNEKGVSTSVNMIIATGHNNLAMNQGVLQVAKKFVHGQKLQEGALNRVEAVIRAFDPCLACSTHAYGEMPLDIRLVSHKGEVLDRVKRN